MKSIYSCKICCWTPIPTFITLFLLSITVSSLPFFSLFISFIYIIYW